MKNVMRAIARGILARKLLAKSEPLVLAKGGVVLVIAPHPDDESFGCGALLARRAAGNETTCVAFVTSGEASHKGHPVLGSSEVGALRRHEATEAMRSVGLAESNIRFLEGPDGSIRDLSGKEKSLLLTKISKLVGEVQPTEILLPARDDGSSEHEAVFELLVQVLAAPDAPRTRVLEFPVWSWWSPRLLARVARTERSIWRSATAPFQAAKKSLIGFHRSQTEPTPPNTRPVLPVNFAAAFNGDYEFFLESPLPVTDRDAAGPDPG
jgi:N-acetylglucosamine malate deacetylase 1